VEYLTAQLIKDGKQHCYVRDYQGNILEQQLLRKKLFV
jgi:hypothetical protein